MASPKPMQTPAWLQEDTRDDIPLTIDVAPIPSSNGQAQPEGLDGKKKMIYWILKVVTMALCILMAGTAVVGLETINSVEDSGKVFVAAYMFLFAAILFAFEAIQIRNIEWIDHMFKRNFGFMYKAMGKALFIIFIAFLSFGLGEPALLSFATGLLLALFGCAEVALYLKYPEIFDE